MGSIIDSLVNEDMTSVKVSNSKSSRAKLFCGTVVIECY